MSVVLNGLDQPLSQDPLGLTRAQFEADPRQTQPIALSQDTRKTVRQNQIGSVIEQSLGAAGDLTARIYGGTRDLDNALSIPLAAQQSPTSAGGIVSFDRIYEGLGLQWSNRFALGTWRTVKLVGGFEYDRSREHRRGFINDSGRAGALRRDENNRVSNRDLYAQAEIDLARDWTAVAGVRRSEVLFSSKDQYLAAGNPDDSGSLSYQALNPVLGVSWLVQPGLNVYANAGRGFETPTFTELAYRPVGSGLNTDLRAARSRHAEIGAKLRLGATQRLDVAVFGIRSRDEIVVATNTGGRSTFRNAGGTRRSGIEIGHVAQIDRDWRSTLSVSALRARYSESFIIGSGAAATTVAAGSRLPGTPERSLFAELAWTPRAAWGGFNAAAELVHAGRLVANDENTEAAASSTIVNVRAGLSQQVGGWRLSQLLRADNVGNRTYAGSVIVNEGNRRYFEAALPRNWTFALSAERPL